MRKTTKFKQSIRAISPVISVLIMIAIAVIASIVAYAYVTGYIGSQTTKTGHGIQLQNYHTGSNLVIYVQNTGQGLVHLKQDGSVYVNSNLKNILRSDGADVAAGALIPLTEGQTVELTIDYVPQANEQLNIKVVTVEGTTISANGNSGGSGGSSGSGSNGSPSYAQISYAVSPPNSGSTNPTGVNINYLVGFVQAITATANDGYTFSSWTFSGPIQINNPTLPYTTVSITSTGNGIITANFVSSSSPKLVYTAGTNQQINVNAPSQALTVQRQDASGGLRTTGSLPVTLTVTGSSTGGLYSDAACTSPLTSNTVTIADGQSSANVYYKDSTAGTPTLTASASGYSSVATTFTIKSLTPTPTPTSNPSNGPTPTTNPSNGPTPTTNPTSGPTPTVSPSPTPTTPPGTQVNVNFVVAPAGSGTTSPSGTQTYTTGTSVPISATSIGSYTFSSWTFSGSIQITNPASASTSATINGAGTVTANFISSTGNKLAFTPGASQTLLSGQPSSAIKVQRQTSSGTPTTSGGAITVTLSATSGAFYSDVYCTAQINSISISSGSSSTANFYYEASAAGTPTLTASAPNYASVSTTFTINNPSSITSLGATTGFDGSGSSWSDGWNDWANPPWSVSADSTHAYSAPQSVTSTSSNEGPFSSDPMDATGAKYITVSFEFMVYQTSSTNFQIRYSGSNSDTYQNGMWTTLGTNGGTLGDTTAYPGGVSSGTSGGTWHQFTVTITDTSAFTSTFRLSFLSQNMNSRAQIWVDNIQVTMYK
jgi:FlaG/FlaF family flagellin (archaellin)